MASRGDLFRLLNQKPGAKTETILDNDQQDAVIEDLRAQAEEAQKLASVLSSALAAVAMLAYLTLGRNAASGVFGWLAYAMNVAAASVICIAIVMRHPAGNRLAAYAGAVTAALALFTLVSISRRSTQETAVALLPTLAIGAVYTARSYDESITRSLLDLESKKYDVQGA